MANTVLLWIFVVINNQSLSTDPGSIPGMRI